MVLEHSNSGGVGAVFRQDLVSWYCQTMYYYSTSKEPNVLRGVGMGQQQHNWKGRLVSARSLRSAVTWSANQRREKKDSINGVSQYHTVRHMMVEGGMLTVPGCQAFQANSDLNQRPSRTKTGQRTNRISMASHFLPFWWVALRSAN